MAMVMARNTIYGNDKTRPYIGLAIQRYFDLYTTFLAWKYEQIQRFNSIFMLQKVLKRMNFLIKETIHFVICTVFAEDALYSDEKNAKRERIDVLSLYLLLLFVQLILYYFPFLLISFWNVQVIQKIPNRNLIFWQAPFQYSRHAASQWKRLVSFQIHL